MKGTSRLLLVCMLVLCLATVGCAGASAADQEAQKNFVGLWDLTGMVSEGEESSQEDLELMKAFGITLYVEYREDHTGTFEAFGEKLGFAWKANSAESVTMTFDDAAVKTMSEDGSVVDKEQVATVSEGTLSMQSDEVTMTFTQIDPADKMEVDPSLFEEDEDGVELEDDDIEVEEVSDEGDADDADALEEDSEDDTADGTRD